jgi:hypothetical protein
MFLKALLSASLLASPIIGSVIPNLEERDDPSISTLETVRRSLHRRTEQFILSEADENPFPCVKWAESVPCSQFDVLIVGGGPSGLQAAMSLGRLARNVLILDSGAYRNDPTFEAHDVIGLDGLRPAEIRQRARDNLEVYKDYVHYLRTQVTSIRSVENATYFEATTPAGTFTGRKVVLASGVSDVLPNIVGMRRIWGAGGFWCPWCDGWEHRGGPLAVLDMSNAGEALAVHKLNPEATILTNGASVDEVFAAEPAEIRQMLVAEGVNILTTKIKSVALQNPRDRRNSPVLITFDDGRAKLYKGFLFTTKRPLHSPWLAGELELGVTNNIIDRKDYTGQTTQFGVWAVGDAASGSKNVANAIFSGKSAAVPIVFRLAYEEGLAKAGHNWRY